MRLLTAIHIGATVVLAVLAGVTPAGSSAAWAGPAALQKSGPKLSPMCDKESTFLCHPTPIDDGYVYAFDTSRDVWQPIPNRRYARRALG